MASNKISKLISYLSILKETLKYKEKEDINTKYEDVDIVLDDEFIIVEHWKGKEDFYHTIRFPAKDIDKRIKTARDHLRYLKKKPDGVKHGE